MQEDYFGFGAVNELKNILIKHNPKNIFLVTGKKSYELCGAKSILEDILKDYNIIAFSQFSLNPKIEDIKQGLELYKKNNCDFVVAVGGGSVIDIAKAINIFVANEGDVVEYIKNEKSIKYKGNPLVAIQTTAGTGSEATHFAVIYINKTKYSLTHKYVLPDYAIIDPQFTMSLPSKITAATGMDALAQAIESYWCVGSTEESKNYASESIKIIMQNLVKSVKNPDEKSRIAMAKASNLAGKAINISKTTAPHAISYPITSYFGIPHGHAVGLTIPSFILYNQEVTEQDVQDKRGVNYVKKTMGKVIHLLATRNAEEAKIKITRLMEDIGLETKLRSLGIDSDEDVELIIKNGFNPDRVKNNPRRLTKESLRLILREIR
ncbi:MAG: phosphonoacetaldehyde reductase [Candidatus Aenigmarchaeota archaeon]|nr:phosphonoacetaldehyde reductase [Candidatus Aenigmarchaeota archaeon]